METEEVRDGDYATSYLQCGSVGFSDVFFAFRCVEMLCVAREEHLAQAVPRARC